VPQNWEGQDSEYPWEREALDHVRDLIADRPGYWGLQCFSFTNLNGRTRECDLLVVTPSVIHLIEIKSHPGRAVNDGTTWYFDHGRPVENPQALGEQKAKELKALLAHQASRLGKRLPRITIVASTFLSAADLRCEFSDHQKLNVYGREGLSAQTGLPGIWSGLIGSPSRRGPAPAPDGHGHPPPRDPHRRLCPRAESIGGGPDMARPPRTPHRPLP
jgi:hypothetical protein